MATLGAGAKVRCVPEAIWKTLRRNRSFQGRTCILIACTFLASRNIVRIPSKDASELPGLWTLVQSIQDYPLALTTQARLNPQLLLALLAVPSEEIQLLANRIQRSKLMMNSKPHSEYIQSLSIVFAVACWRAVSCSISDLEMDCPSEEQ